TTRSTLTPSRAAMFTQNSEKSLPARNRAGRRGRKSPFSTVQVWRCRMSPLSSSHLKKPNSEDLAHASILLHERTGADHVTTSLAKTLTPHAHTYASSIRRVLLGARHSRPKTWRQPRPARAQLEIG